MRTSKLATQSDRLPRTVMAVLWPSFLMACVTSGLLFSLVDPAELILLDSKIQVSPLGMYTIGFFIFWSLGAIASGLTALLMIEKD